jgi:serpin B
MRRILIAFLLRAVPLFVLTVGCSPIVAPQERQDQTEKETAGKSDLEFLVRGNNEFALDLYRRLAKQAAAVENVVFSPYSISNALAMTYAGARGETAEQMAKVLHFSLREEQLHRAFAKLIADLQKDDKERPYQLYIANALWGQQGYPFLEAFLRIGSERYRAGIKELDFAGQTEQARRTINRWVEEQTKDKIKELLGPNDLNPPRPDQRHLLQGSLGDAVPQGGDQRGAV